MRATQHQHSEQSKQRLRNEISNHVEDFLHSGGRIEVVSTLSPGSTFARLGHRPAAADLTLISSLLDD